MADSLEIVPFNDPEVSEEFLAILDDRNPTLEDLTIHEPIQQNPPLIPEQGDEIRSSDDFQFEFSGSGTGSESGSGSDGGWNPQNFASTPNFDQAGPSEFHGESSNTAANSANVQTGNAEFYTEAELKILREFPPTPYIFGCSACNILRKITHTNGVETTNLALHGQTGVIFHAFFEHQTNNEENNPKNEVELFDFSKSNMVEVREFLVQYCLEKQNAGFYVVNDPLSLFYETICIGLYWAESPFLDEPFPPFTAEKNPVEEVQEENKNDQPMDQPQPQQQQPQRTPLSLQRERTGKMTVKDLVPYFHLPIEEAARRLDMCPTVVKKICRRDGVGRWPHRRLKSTERNISQLAAVLCSDVSPREKARAQEKIRELEQEMENIRQCRG